MQLITPVDTASMPFTIDHSTPLLSLGSCFADEIGSRLQRDGFLILCNPFGTLYNPLSIAAALQLAIHDTELTDSHLVFHNGLWHSLMHHRRFSSHERDECLARSNKAIHDTHRQGDGLLPQRPGLHLLAQRLLGGRRGWRRTI